MRTFIAILGFSGLQSYVRKNVSFLLLLPPPSTDVSPHPRGAERGHHHHHLHHPHHHSVGGGGASATSTFSPHGKQRFIATRPKSYSGGPSAGEEKRVSGNVNCVSFLRISIRSRVRSSVPCCLKMSKITDFEVSPQMT